MIEDLVKDKIFGITSYCDTTEKLNVLIETINLIRQRFPDFKIAHQSNYPLSAEIQVMTDMYFYQDLNFTHFDKWIYYWNIIINPKNMTPFFQKKFFYTIKDSGYSVFQQIRALCKHLIDYNWVMLINYDTCVEEIRMEDYNADFDLIVHHFPDQEAYSLIMMGFKPKVFYEKVAKHFTYENWIKPERIDQLNEARFYDMVHEGNVNHQVHRYLVHDKISSEPDYKKPNAPTNPFFTTYLMVLSEDKSKLEIYLWGLLGEDIKNIAIKINKRLFVLDNQNKNNGFEHLLELNQIPDPEEIGEFDKVQIIMIDNIDVDVELRIKKGYYVRSI